MKHNPGRKDRRTTQRQQTRQKGDNNRECHHQMKTHDGMYELVLGQGIKGYDKLTKQWVK